jgi:hypothetical protein
MPTHLAHEAFAHSLARLPRASTMYAGAAERQKALVVDTSPAT